MIKNVFVLGSTGSIGRNTLDIIKKNPKELKILGLSAYNQMNRLAEQASNFCVPIVLLSNSLAKKDFIKAWKKMDKNIPEIRIGEQELVDSIIDSSCDIVVIAIPGIAGLAPALAAAKAGKRILLANKESLVIAGQLLIQAIQNSGAKLLPIDSEHNAIMQCLPQNFQIGSLEKTPPNGVKNLLLTASGGPFLKYHSNDLKNVTPKQACSHPNWKMGKKISVDSSTMLNKGFEVIEAYWLFSMPINRIKVIIHPQSIVHSMVEYEDHSILAQLSQPDMRIPISYALGLPNRIKNNGVDILNLSHVGHLDFLEIDSSKFPCFSLSLNALGAGQGACIVLNAANEVAVEAFLSGKLGYTSIHRVIEISLEWYSRQCETIFNSLEEIMELDQRTRHFVKNLDIYKI